eukprot:TRINITY_DN245_c1_g1_i1.p1 TRINITY_DN245_c1_g1~~TRINITY_DN245_c1_g1_i1.p1  ORF type:complete len:352 (+),score=66.57 TRINITY_DN245_c1_g1_i1:84-1139(+)
MWRCLLGRSLLLLKQPVVGVNVGPTVAKPVARQAVLLKSKHIPKENREKKPSTKPTEKPTNAQAQKSQSKSKSTIKKGKHHRRGRSVFDLVEALPVPPKYDAQKPSTWLHKHGWNLNVSRKLWLRYPEPSYWTIARYKPRLDGHRPQVWGVLTWRGKPYPAAEKIHGPNKRDWMWHYNQPDSFKTLMSYAPKKKKITKPTTPTTTETTTATDSTKTKKATETKEKEKEKEKKESKTKTKTKTGEKTTDKSKKATTTATATGATTTKAPRMAQPAIQKHKHVAFELSTPRRMAVKLKKDSIKAKIKEAKKTGGGKPGASGGSAPAAGGNKKGGASKEADKGASKPAAKGKKA